ncbi:N-acetylmuramoyl-L-alanine amidase [Sphingorhabdus lutea]|uniref:N-acetylmuramoyl-L-alanine amidase n=1 Tax=Sphingorhabdus lutea TaxID=1913578 RepID=A0A1L3JER4_9SPHN|nr:N-acetylmuramoyl-L-alanine amidase [Sphingorhabdus lutea]APG63616.1 N-acetylmuramoyl-L-alanine amidase [Sphingorhabdus lutea]
MSMLLSIITSLFFSPQSWAAQLSNVVIDNESVTIEFDDVVNQASSFYLANPNRIVVDVSGANMGKIGSKDGALGALRVGQYDPNTARIVLDLANPAILTRGGFSSDGRKLQLFFGSAATDQFFGALKQSRMNFIPPFNFRADKPKKYEVSAPILPADSKGKLPKIYGPNDTSLPLVVIDAGHGGHDPGAISKFGGGHKEKNVTLAIAKAIRDELISTGRVRVALTRDDDSFIVLQDRYGIARKMDADLFISVHADAAGNESASGATVYTLSEVASDREAQRLAARENKSDIISGLNLGGADSSVSSILIDLTQRETMNVSADFARIFLREAGPNVPLRSNSHRFASFVVLKSPDVPSILLETGYLTNDKDVAFLTSAAGKKAIATSMADAVRAHFARRIAAK